MINNIELRNTIKEAVECFHKARNSGWYADYDLPAYLANVLQGNYNIVKKQPIDTEVDLSGLGDRIAKYYATPGADTGD